MINNIKIDARMSANICRDQVGADEADARAQLARMPLGLGHPLIARLRAPPASASGAERLRCTRRQREGHASMSANLRVRSSWCP